MKNDRLINTLAGIALAAALAGCVKRPSAIGDLPSAESASDAHETTGKLKAAANKEQGTKMSEVQPNDSTFQLATFGAGCFWCVEAVFEQIEGVVSVESGYAGGTVANPSYEDVCLGSTGHAEVCQIKYDPAKITFPDLLEIFWKTHDPTTPNQQGNDVGTQYRSVIFYHDERQKESAEVYKKKLNESGAWRNPVITEISPLPTFYRAEEYHQDYYALNPHQGYCAFTVRPKVDKVREVFKDKLK